MKKLCKALSLILLLLCAVVFVSCGESGTKPSISVSENNLELVFGDSESATFDVSLTGYGNGSDAIRIESYDENIISFSSKKQASGKYSVTVNAVYPGSANLKISSIQGSADPVNVSVKVVLPLESIAFKDLNLSMVKGDSVDLSKLDLIEYTAIKTQISSLDNARTNQIGVRFDIDDFSKNAGASIIDGVVSLPETFDRNQIVVTATSIFNEKIKEEIEIKVLNKILTKLFVDDVQIFENAELCENVSSAFEVYPRENEQILRTKQIKLVANSGDGTDLINVTPIYNTEKLSVILKSFEYQNGSFVYNYELTALNSGLQDDLSFAVSYRDNTISSGVSYFATTGKLNITTYTIPTSVLVNKSSGINQNVDIVVYQDVIQIARGTSLTFGLSPDDLAPEYTQIRIWAEDFSSLPVNLYRLNQDRSAYDLLFGYNGNNAVFTGRDNLGNYYLDIDEGTKLFAITNSKANANNMTAKLFAISRNFYATEDARSKLQLSLSINPSSQDVYLADRTESGYAQNTKSLVLSQIDETSEVIFAISPYNFNIGTTSSVRLKNSSLADVSSLEVLTFDENYLYVKVSITPKKLGATKLVVTLCDGLVKEFDLKIISRTESLNVYLKQDFDNQLDYRKTITENKVTVNVLAMKNNLSLELNKVVSPITAEYTLNFEFCEDFDNTLASYTSVESIIDGKTFLETSTLVDVSLLKNYSILQASSNSAKGKVLIKITANTRDENGNFKLDDRFVFYYFVEFYSGVEYFSVSKSAHEIYTYESVGDKNIEKSITEFSVSMRSIGGNPTYADKLVLVYNGSAIITKDKLSYPYRENNENNENNDNNFTVSASFKDNVWNFRIQALKGEDVYVFTLKLVELDESKTIGGIVRVFVRNAVEISQIELIDVNTENGIYIDNSATLDGEKIEYQIQYNVYTENNIEPLNSSLEFELVGNFGGGVSISDSGKLVAKAGAGGSGYIKIYPTSNYFYVSNGLNGDKPFVIIPLTVANGNSEESAIRIITSEDLNKLKANKFYKLVADVDMSSSFTTIESFSGKLNGNGHVLTVCKPLFETIAVGGVVKNLTLSGNATECALAVTNNGSIENVSASGLTIAGTDAGTDCGAIVKTNNGTISGGEIVASLSGKNVGGVAQINAGTISGVTFAGNIVVSAAEGNVGGIVATNSGTIESCKVIKYAELSGETAKSIITDNSGASHIGAIAGTNGGTISKCFGARYGKDVFDIISTGASTFVGGIVGLNAGTISECNTNLNMSAAKVGGLVGKYESGNVTNCFVRSKVNSSEAKNFAFAGSLGNFSNCYSTAYYLDDTTKKYLTDETAGSLYCKANEDFSTSVASLSGDKWLTDSSKNGGLPYLKNAFATEAVENFELTIQESNKFLHSENTIVLFYNKLISGANSEVASKELENLNTISLSSLFGAKYEDYKLSVSSTNSIQNFAGKIKIVGTGKTMLEIQSKFASESCLNKTYTIYVVYPLSSFNVFEGKTISAGNVVENNDKLSVKYNESKYFTAGLNETVVLDNQTYSLYTNLASIGVKASKTSDDLNAILEGMQTSFDNTNYTDYKFVGEGVFKVSPNKIEENKIEEYENSIDVEVFYAVLNSNFGSYYGNLDSSDIDAVNAILKAKFAKTFELNVYQGADKIQTSISETTITASDVLNFDVKLDTDYSKDKILVKIYDENNNLVEYYDGSSQSSFDLEGKAKTDNNLFDIKVVETSTSKQYNVYVNINEKHKGDFDRSATYKIVVCDSTGKVTITSDVLTTDESGRVVSNITLNIVPQQVLRISAYHYAADSSDSSFSVQSQPTVVLKPGTNGLIAINLYPIYSKFEKIVIESEKVDDYYILFEQMKKNESGETYSSTSGEIGYTSERVDNKLIIYPNSKTVNNGMIYVRTKILGEAPDGCNFPITITVYPSFGQEVKVAGLALTSQTINKAEITIDGKKDAVGTRGNSIAVQIVTREDEYLGNVSVADYTSSLGNNDYININVNSAEYETINGFNVYNGYINIGLDAEISGDGVVKIQTTMFRNINGRTESAVEFATLRIVDFTVDGVYIDGNNEDDNVFVVPLQIEKNLSFAFKLSPLPVVANMDNNTSIARIKANRDYFLKNTAIKIATTYSINNELVFDDEKIEDVVAYSNKLSDNEKTASFVYNIYSNGSKVFERNGIVRNNNYVEFNIEKDDGKAVNSNLIMVTGLRTGNVNFSLKFDIVYPGAYSETFNYNFVVSVREYEDEDNPLPIATEEDFIKYMNATSTESGEPANYILLNDLYLTDFVPIANTNLIETLDGNNKIITIKNFNLDAILGTNAGQTLNLALFRNISNNTTIKNVTLNYFELEDIIVDENLVSEVNAAGLFINNNGIVYNCEVTSIDLATEKSKISTEMGSQFDDFGVGIHQNYSGKKFIDGNGIRIYFDGEEKSKIKRDETIVNVAGFGLNNTSSGRITNSRFGSNSFTKLYRYVDDAISTVKEISLNASMFNITAQAEIAGFVLTNSGLISSSCADNFNIKNTAIAGTNLRTAGFVVENSYGAYITSSFARGHKDISDLNSPFYRGGGILSQGISAGFVFENNARIVDCFANVNLTGSSSSRIVSGFVYANESSANIERCYSASTISGELTTRMPFSGANAKGESMQNGKLSHCYYLVLDFETDIILEEKYQTGAYGLYAGKLSEDSFYGFSFCDDKKSGVWFFSNKEANIASTLNVAISARYIVKNYNGKEGVNKFPYLSGYELGSDKNPIVIRNADEFNRAFGDTSTLKPNAYYALAEKYNKNTGFVFGSYRLISNIDFSSLSSVSNTKVASSIMTLRKTEAGSGILDGNGLSISNVEVALADSECVGFIGQLQNGATVKNFNISIVQISGANGVYVGGVCGLCIDSSIVNVSVESINISGENRSEINGRNVVGGVVGMAKGNSKLANLSSNVSVVSNYLGNTEYNRLQSSLSFDKKLGYAGGIAGIIDIYSSSSQTEARNVNVNKLFVYGNSLIVKGYHVGGISGYLGKSTNAKDLSFRIDGVTDSTKQQLVSTGNVIGGLVAVNFGTISESSIEHETSVQKLIESSFKNIKNLTSKQGNSSFFAFENETIESYAGGLVGIMEDGELTHCFSKVDVYGTQSSYAGGLVGFNKSSKTFREVYAFGDVYGIVAGGLIGKNGVSSQNGNVTLSKAVAINFYTKNNQIIVQTEADMAEIASYVNSLSNGVNSLSGSNNSFPHKTYGTGTISYSNGKITFTYGTQPEQKIIEYKVDVDSTGKITSVVPNSLGSLAGENNATLDIGEKTTDKSNNQNVYANKNFTMGSLKYSLSTCASGSGTIKQTDAEVNSLSVEADNFAGESDYPKLNSMFLGADWDEQIWQKSNSDMLPKLIHGVVSKVLYIEVPKDFLKLWKYNEGAVQVIIGDNPATSFNPYKYDKDNLLTYGEYSASDLTGLHRVESELYYDLKEIEKVFKNSNFNGGILKGEEGHKFYIYNLGTSLFNAINNATISNIGFGSYSKSEGEIARYSSSLLANTVEDSKLENIYVKNLNATLDSPQTEAGLLVNSLVGGGDKSTLKDFAFENVVVEITGNSNEDLTFGFICPELNGITLIENASFSGCQVSVSNSKTLQLGLIAGTNYETSGEIYFKNVYINASNLSNLNANKITATASRAHIGGFVGNLNVTSTLNYDESTNTNPIEAVKDLTIDFSGVTTSAYVGLVFGNVNKISSGNNISISGEIKNDQSTDENYVASQIGGFAGEGFGTIKNVTISCPITVKVSGASDKNASIGGVVGNASGALTLENITQDGNITVTSTNVKTNVGGVVGQAIASGLTTTEDVYTLGLSDIIVGTITGEEPNQTITEISASSTGVANVGGIIGFAQNQTTSLTITSGKTITINSNITATGGNFNVGGVVGDIETSSLTMKAKCEVKSNFDVNGSAVNVGGVIGNATGTTVTISDGKDNSNADIHYTTTASGNMTISATGISKVGGILGEFSGGTLTISSSKNVYSGKIYYTNTGSGTAYIGGVAGYISATSGSEIKNSHFNNGIITLIGTYNASMIAGGIAGYVQNCNITSCYVSGHIEVPKTGETPAAQTISKDLYIGGVVGQAKNSEIKSTLSWGNIRLCDVITSNDPIINIGGVLGNAVLNDNNPTVTLNSNSTLTSIYNTKWLGDNAYIHAIVGSGTLTSSSDNTYSSQYNLATDSTTNGSDEATLSLFINDNNDKKDKLGNDLPSKLSPIVINDQTTFTNDKTAFGGYKYYSLSDLTISGLNIPANAHVLGNGNTLKNYSENNNVVTLSNDGKTSIVGTNNGVIANAKFDFKTTFETSSGNLLSDAPSGIAKTNKGIIYGCVAKIAGNDLTNSYEKSKWTQSFNSGAVQTNSGLIADTGAVVYGKNAYAGFVKDNQGTISNCYANGVVQNGAMFSFNGNSTGDGKKTGVVYNSYTSVRSSGIINTSEGSNHIFNGTLISCFYDKNGTEQTQTGVTEKASAKTDSDYQITDGTMQSSLKFNASTNWAVNSSKNFGYPYLGNRAFETGSQIPNLGVLEKITTKVVDGVTIHESSQNITILTDLDYANADCSHTPFAYKKPDDTNEKITFEGNNFEISSIPSNFFTTLTNATVQNANFTFVKTPTLNATDNSLGALANTAYGTTLNHIVVSGANITTSATNVGGVVGIIGDTSIIWNVYNHNTIDITSGSAQYVGGIIGKVSKSSIGSFINSYTVGNYGNISVKSDADLSVGGIAGSIVNESLYLSLYLYNMSNVSASSSADKLLYIGGIVGELNYGTTISQNHGKVSTIDGNAAKTYIGGIVGFHSTQSNSITESFNYGEVSGSTSDEIYAGGIAGYSEANISSCGNEGAVSGTSSNNVAYVGGIAGYATNEITSCYNMGSVNGTGNDGSALGGIAGYATANITNCSSSEILTCNVKNKIQITSGASSKNTSANGNTVNVRFEGYVNYISEIDITIALIYRKSNSISKHQIAFFEGNRSLDDAISNNGSGSGTYYSMSATKRLYCTPEFDDSHPFSDNFKYNNILIVFEGKTGSASGGTKASGNYVSLKSKKPYYGGGIAGYCSGNVTNCYCPEYDNNDTEQFIIGFGGGTVSNGSGTPATKDNLVDNEGKLLSNKLKWTNHTQIPTIDNKNKIISVANAAQLAWVAKNPNYWGLAYTINITADIDLRGYIWEPISRTINDSQTYFMGMIQGNGHTIDGLTTRNNIHDVESFGFIGLYVSNCGIFDLKLISYNGGTLIGQFRLSEYPENKLLNLTTVKIENKIYYDYSGRRPPGSSSNALYLSDKIDNYLVYIQDTGWVNKEYINNLLANRNVSINGYNGITWKSDLLNNYKLKHNIEMYSQSA